MSEGSLLKNFFFGRNNSAIYLSTHAQHDFFYGIPQRQKQLVTLAKAQVIAQRETAAAIERSNNYLAQEIRQFSASIEASLNSLADNIVGAIDQLEYSLVCELREVKWLLAQQGEYLREIIQILKNRRKVEANELLRQALLNLTNGYYEEAEGRLLLALEFDNTDYQIHRNLGLIFLHTDNANKAVEHFQKSLAFAYNSRLRFEALGDLSRIYYSIGSFDEAAETASQLMTLLKAESNIANIDEIAKSWYIYGVYHGLAKNINSCLEGLENAIELRSKYFAIAGFDRDLELLRYSVNDFLKTKAENAAKVAESSLQTFTSKRKALEKYNGEYNTETLKVIDDHSILARKKMKNASYTDLLEINQNCQIMVEILGLVENETYVNNEIEKLKMTLKNNENKLHELEKREKEILSKMQATENRRAARSKSLNSFFAYIAALITFVVGAGVMGIIINSIFNETHRLAFADTSEEAIRNIPRYLILFVLGIALLFFSGPLLFIAAGKVFNLIEKHTEEIGKPKTVTREEPHEIRELKNNIQEQSSKLYNLEKKLKELTSIIPNKVTTIGWKTKN